METININLYTVTELSEGNQQKAYENWLQNVDYPFAKDNEDVLYEFSNYFSVKIKDFSYDQQSASVSFEINEDIDILQLTGIRLLKYIQNNYFNVLFQGKYYGKLSPYDNKNGQKIEKSKHHPIGQRHIKRHSKVIFEPRTLTGYYLGEIILEPFHNFIQKPDHHTLEDLIYDCIDKWKKTVKEDVEYYISFENFIEEAERNGMQFTENGNIW